MHRKLKLEDLARVLKLSKFSVSRALSGKPGVSDSTRDRVLKTAREMGYHHANTSDAQAPEVRDVRLIIPSADAIRSSFWIEVIDGAETEAQKLGYRLNTFVLGDASNDFQPMQGKVTGLILAGRRSRGVLEPYIQLNVPKVLIGHPKPMENLDSVQSANFDGGFAAGKILTDYNHRRIAFFTDALDDEGRNLRHAGLVEAARLVDGAVQAFEFDENRDGKLMALEALRSDLTPTAFACATDFVAMNLSWALIELGLHVPKHVSIVGSNDTHTASALGMRLTTVRQPVHEIGAAAIQALDWRLTIAPPESRPRRTLLTPQLIERSTHGRCDAEGLQLALSKIENSD